MYSKDQVRQFKTEFWTNFGVYMKKHPNRGVIKINWVNYKTRIKDVYFRLDATNKKAAFAIEIQHKDKGIRELFYEQFLELKTVLNSRFEHDLIWETEYINEFHVEISKIGCEIENVNIYDKNTWADAYKFFETNMLSIDAFWIDFNEIFKQLE